MTATSHALGTIRLQFIAVRDWLGRFPFWILQLGLRLGVGMVFFNAGLLKFNSFEFAVKLFEDIYKVPFLPPAIAARITMFNELTWPILLFAGFASRLATLPLLGQLIVMEYALPSGWKDNVFWASALLVILTRGPGAISVDYLIERVFRRRERSTP